MLRYTISSKPKDVKKHFKMKKKVRKQRITQEKEKQLLIKKREMQIYFPLPMQSQKNKKKEQKSPFHHIRPEVTDELRMNPVQETWPHLKSHINTLRKIGLSWEEVERRTIIEFTSLLKSKPAREAKRKIVLAEVLASKNEEIVLPLKKEPQTLSHKE